MHKTSSEGYSKTESTKRLEAALRGARIVGHKPMSGITPKRTKAQRKAKATAPKSV